MAENVIEFSDQSFDSGVLESDVPVLVDFWAVWCGPCKAIAPIIEEIANDYDGKVKVGKVDVDNNNQVAMKYGIRSIPTLLLFKGGEVVDQVIGNVGKESIESMLKNWRLDTICTDGSRSCLSGSSSSRKWRIFYH